MINMIGINSEEVNELLVGCGKKLGIDYKVPTRDKSTEEKDIEEIQTMVKSYRRTKVKTPTRVIFKCTK